jgi:hypothetical protein
MPEVKSVVGLGRPFVGRCRRVSSADLGASLDCSSGMRMERALAIEATNRRAQIARPRYQGHKPTGSDSAPSLSRPQADGLR